mgnify:CR=1 FL=1
MVAGHAMVMPSSGEPRGHPGAIPGGRSRGYVMSSRNLSFWLFMVTLQVAVISGDTAIHEPMYEPLRNSTNGFLQLHETQATEGRMLQVADTLSDTGSKPQLVLPRGHSTLIAHWISGWITLPVILAFLGLMQQARGARLARVPDPPAWNPDSPNALPYSTWTQRLMVWGILAVDVDPSQQCAAIVERLGGSARELADALSWQELTTGGVIGGQAMDPVTFLLTQLAAHYAPFGEERRVASMVELMSFHRLPQERIDALMARYRTLRWRAAQGGGGMLMNWEGYSWLPVSYTHLTLPTKA